jgi:hypothetical protein
LQILKNKITEVMGEGYYPEIRRQAKEPEKKNEETVKNEVQEEQRFTATQIEEEEPVVGEIINLFGGRVEKD